MNKLSNVIAIVSPKGGVGKTVTASNLASALSLFLNKKILVVDTNISSSSLSFHFGIFYPKYVLQDFLTKGFKKEFLIKYHENLHIIPSSIKINKKEKNLTDIRKNIYKLTEKYFGFLNDISKNYDFVFLDCSPGFDLETIAALNLAGGVIIVTNPDYPSLVSSIRMIEYCKRIGIPIGGIVLSKVMKKRYEPRIEDIEKNLGIKFIGVIPFDKNIPKSIAKGKPIVLLNKFSKASRAYKKIASSMINKKSNSIIKRIFKWLKS